MFNISFFLIFFKSHLSIFLGLFLGFMFIAVYEFFHVFPEFYVDFIMNIALYIKDSILNSETFEDNLLEKFFFLSLFLITPISMIALVISLLCIKLKLCYKKISLSVMVAPFILLIIAIASKMKEGPAPKIESTGFDSSGGAYGITSTPISTSFWEEYIEIIQVQIVCACLFIVFFVIFFRIIKKLKSLKEMTA